MHFNYISLSVNHGVNHNGATDPGALSQDGIDRGWPKNESRCLYVSTDTNRTLWC